MLAVMNQPGPDNSSHKPKPKAKRVITEARKIQNREAQRAYRLRQKERQRAHSQKEAVTKEQSTSARSSSAYPELRPYPPVGNSPDSAIPIPPPSWSFPVQDVDADVPDPAAAGVEDQGIVNGEIISPQAHDLTLTPALNLNLTADPLSVPLPGSNLAASDESIDVPGEPHAFPGLDMQIDPLLSGLELFPQSSSDLESHVSGMDDYFPTDDQLLLSFQQSTSNTQTSIHYDYTSNTQHISTSDVPSVPTQPQPQPARRAKSHAAKQTSKSASAPANRPKSTSRPTTVAENPTDSKPIFQANSPSKSTSTSASNTNPDSKPTIPSPTPASLPNPHTNHLTPLATFFLTGTMYNAHCLGMSIEQFFSLECNSLGSPFYQRVTSASTDPKTLLASVIATNPFIPTHLRPTLPQILIEHHPIFDLIPLAGLRSRAIIISATMPGLVDMLELKKDIIGGGLVCRGSCAGEQEKGSGVFQMGMRMGLGIGSGQPWDLRSWEVSDWFWRKWRLLLDGEGEGSGGDLWGQ
ncbi:uncharacterized protein BDV14DRAFT_179414 [Aspergillus stella-maris]|uniref:uncharacterized protein n=1 Tax=Aspergillus stella-maris TaxID=1810926 RepID=UPI003CCDA87D